MGAKKCFADIGVINSFSKILFVAVQNFKLGCLQKFKFRSMFFLGFLFLINLDLVFWTRTISLIYW